jgi:hypothetical protein
MVASVDTVNQLIHVLQTHVDDKTMTKIIQDLELIPGNQSFKDTVIRLKKMHNERQASVVK